MNTLMQFSIILKTNPLVLVVLVGNLPSNNVSLESFFAMYIVNGKKSKEILLSSLPFESLFHSHTILILVFIGHFAVKFFLTSRRYLYLQYIAPLYLCLRLS